MTSARIILIEEDCTVLLERALLRQTLVAFGEDGCGKYGRKDTPSYFDVVDVRVNVYVDDENSPTVISGGISICLHGYNANDVGHIKSDKNFDISLNVALAAAGISKDTLIWAKIDEQVAGCVTFYLDIGKLLGWS